MRLTHGISIAAVLLSLVACGEAGLGSGTTTSSGAGASSAGGAGGQAPVADPTGFRKTAAAAHARYHHTATRLRDGRVLVVGGEDIAHTPFADAEVFDPSFETWSPVAPLPSPRTNHTATLLADGRVLVTGGGLTEDIGLPSGVGVLKSAVVFDPDAGTWTPVADMAEARAGHAALLLPDGRVAVVGGATDQIGSQCNMIHPNCTIGKTLATAEVFDPASGAWSAAGSMSHPRIAFSVSALADRRVLVIGGADDTTSLTSTEIFDPTSLAFTETGALAGDRLYLGATTLGSGKVVAVGGKKADVAPLATTEIYDPAAGAWSPGPKLDEVRTASAVLTLTSGHAISIGGFDQFKSVSLKEVVLYDEAVGAWTPIGSLVYARTEPTATLLSDGRVLVVGGTEATVGEISQ